MTNVDAATQGAEDRYTPSETEGRDSLVDYLSGDWAANPHPLEEAEQIADRFIAKIKSGALREFATELLSQEVVSADDALTAGVLQERADEIEGRQ